MKVYVVLAINNLDREVDSVYQNKNQAEMRKYELIGQGDAQQVEIIEKDVQ